MLRLQLKQAGARNDEEDYPDDPWRHPQSRVEQLRAAKPEQDHSEQVGSGTDHQIGKARDNGSERADEILRGAIWGRDVAERNPGGKILRCVRDQGEEEQRS